MSIKSLKRHKENIGYFLQQDDQGVRDDETVTLAKFLENVDGGIMTSNMEIYPKFNEIIIKRSQISDSKKVKKSNFKRKGQQKNYDNNTIIIGGEYS
ncbi:unnamed protein product [Rhizophagus irregularis]|nr:unnamed protein product [Rhizophagus irregularis]